MRPDQFPLKSSFGELLRTQSIASGLTQAELAARTGLSVRGLSDLERGVRTRPQRETVQRLLAWRELFPAFVSLTTFGVPESGQGLVVARR